MDQGCQVTTAAIQNVFRQRGIEITEAEANSRSAKAAHKADATSKKSALRHVMLTTCAEKWKAATGAEPTEWDLEALWKTFAAAVRDEVSKAKAVRSAADVVRTFQRTGTKVAITSDFGSDQMEPWLRVAHAEGFEFDGSLSCADVPNPGSSSTWMCVPPAPWRCHTLAAQMNIFPMDSIVRVSSTDYGIEEGLNAGMWTVALTTTGVMSPLRLGESEAERADRVSGGFYRLGAHFVIDGIWALPRVIDEITARMNRGEKP